MKAQLVTDLIDTKPGLEYIYCCRSSGSYPARMKGSLNKDRWAEPVEHDFMGT